MHDYRTFEEYKQDVASKLDKEELTHWCYDMSSQLNHITSFVKNLPKDMTISDIKETILEIGEET